MSVALTLDGARTARHQGGRPRRQTPGGGRLLLLGCSTRRAGGVRSTSRAGSSHATTGPDGVATFDWLPATREDLTFWPSSEGYANRRVVLKEGENGAGHRQADTNRGDPGPCRPPRRLARRGHRGPRLWLRARDGQRPRPGTHGCRRVVRDECQRGRGLCRLRRRQGLGRTDLASTSSFARASRSTESTSSSAGGPSSAGRSPSAPATGPHPTNISGSTKPGAAPGRSARGGGPLHGAKSRRQFGATTDSAGHYSIRVGPGTYTVMGPPRTGDEKITIKDEAEVVRDFRMPRPEKGTINGRVVVGGQRKRGGRRGQGRDRRRQHARRSVRRDGRRRRAGSKPNASLIRWSSAPRVPMASSGRSSRPAPKIPRS